MSTPNEFENDPLDVVLGGKGKISGDDSIRQAVLAGTIGVIRRRRRLKRCAVAGTLLVCYLAGMATMVFWRAGGEGLSKSSAIQIAIDNTAKRPAAAISDPEPGQSKGTVSFSQTQKSGQSLAQLPPVNAGPPDQKAVYTTPSQFEVLRRTGDKYLQDPEKMQLAIRTYARALKYASAEERAISPEHDTWLLMALKDAHSKEGGHSYPSKEKKHESSQL
jgi:hypothetical protein